uniref:Uncharacterized protein n=1 Tax=Oryza brachyantha TaxID=4533 RepID=J3KU03_ORYBR
MKPQDDGNAASEMENGAGGGRIHEERGTDDEGTGRLILAESVARACGGSSGTPETALAAAVDWKREEDLTANGGGGLRTALATLFHGGGDVLSRWRRRPFEGTAMACGVGSLRIAAAADFEGGSGRLRRRRQLPHNHEAAATV